MKNLYILCMAVATVILLAACSTTKHLPEGEILYIGQRPTLVDNPQPTSVGETALEEVEAALAKAPNNSLLGSTSVRIPFPLGLWCIMASRSTRKGWDAGYSTVLPPSLYFCPV